MSNPKDPQAPSDGDGLPVALRQAVSLLDDSPAQDPSSASQATRQPAGATASGPARAVTPGQPVRVQIVEDLPRVQQLLRQLVEQAGEFQVTAIDDTEQQALARFTSEEPDALVVDLNLRQGSGLGLINAIRRKSAAWPSGPLIIVVTNHTMPILQAACMKAGADHFLDKSRELTRLPTLLQHCFQP